MVLLSFLSHFVAKFPFISLQHSASFANRYNYAKIRRPQNNVTLTLTSNKIHIFFYYFQLILIKCGRPIQCRCQYFKRTQLFISCLEIDSFQDSDTITFFDNSKNPNTGLFIQYVRKILSEKITFLTPCTHTCKKCQFFGQYFA